MTIISRRGIFGFVGLVGFTAALTLGLESCKKKSTSTLQADESGNPYNFTGGACQTSGRWTEAALNQARQIKAVIERLKEDPKCTAMSNSLANMHVTMENRALGAGQGSDGTTDEAVAQIYSIGSEITSLGKYRRAKARQAGWDGIGLPNPDGNIDKLMNDRMFQILGMNASKADGRDDATGGVAGPAGEVGRSVEQVVNMKARGLRLAGEGLDAATSVFNTLAADQQCLINKSSELGSLMIAGSKMLGAYVGSDAGLGAKAGDAIAAYFNFVRQKKSNDALRLLNQSEFILSISCLIETTTGAYCEMRDAQYIQRDLTNQLNSGRPREKLADKTTPRDMLTGFTVMNQDAPVVADWLRKAVTGVTPRRASDAAYYNSVMGMLTGLQQILTQAQTAINETESNLKTLEGKKEKNGAILKLATQVNEIFMMGQSKLDSAGSGNMPDFYGQVSPPVRQIFDILGMPLPDQCNPQGKENTTQVYPALTYLDDGGTFQVMGDPSVLIPTMRKQVDIIFQKMSSNITKFVRQNLNIDQQNVAADFIMPSVTGNPLRKLQQVRTYFNSLTTRINASVDEGSMKAEDVGFLDLFEDTLARIDIVLDAERGILDYAKSRRAESKQKQEESDKREQNQIELTQSEDESGLGLAKVDKKPRDYDQAQMAEIRRQVVERYTGPQATEEDKQMAQKLSRVRRPCYLDLNPETGTFKKESDPTSRCNKPYVKGATPELDTGNPDYDNYHRSSMFTDFVEKIVRQQMAKLALDNVFNSNLRLVGRMAWDETRRDKSPTPKGYEWTKPIAVPKQLGLEGENAGAADRPNVGVDQPPEDNSITVKKTKGQELSENLLSKAFDAFDMLRFREAFFVNRVANAVYWDLSKQLVTMQREQKAAQGNPAAMALFKTKWSGVSQKVLTMADNFMVDTMNNLMGRQLHDRSIDFANATKVNFANIKSLELFKETIMRELVTLKSIVVYKHVKDSEIKADINDLMRKNSLWGKIFGSTGVYNPFSLESNVEVIKGFGKIGDHWNIKSAMWGPAEAFKYASIRNVGIKKAVFGANTGGLTVSDLVDFNAVSDAVAPAVSGFQRTQNVQQNLMTAFLGRNFRPDLYWAPYYWTDSTNFRDDRSKSLALFRGLLCAQTLAFPNPLEIESDIVTSVFAGAPTFAEVCKGAVLRSSFEPIGEVGKYSAKDPDTGFTSIDPNKGTINPDALSLSYDDWIKSYKFFERNAKNRREFDGLREDQDDPRSEFQASRICAVYDHLRNNRIHQLKMRNLPDDEIVADLQKNQGSAQ